jgi:hypothetical protein
LTIKLPSQSFPEQDKMPFKEAFKEVNRRDSWPPTILRLHDDLSPEEIDENPFAYFLTSPGPEDDDEYEYYEDLSAGIEASDEPKTPVREVSPSSLQRTPLETAEDSHAGKGFAMPLSLRDFSIAPSNSKKEKKALHRTADLDHIPQPPPTPALRGRGIIRLPPNRPRGQTRSRSLSSPRPRSWCEPSPDVWSIPEEKEDTGLDDVPPLSLDWAEDSAQASGAEEALIFEEPTEPVKKKSKKRVHWGFLPTRDD